MTNSTFISIPPNSDFTLTNIPFGIFSTSNNASPHIGTAIGDSILDLTALSTHSFLLDSLAQKTAQEIAVALRESTLNVFAALGKVARIAVRDAVLELVKTGNPHEETVKKCLVNRHDAKTHLPMTIGDYTDFYAGKNHAYNVGVLFRGAANALQPNYSHLPVGYHGRASTVVVSGTPIRRPLGQTMPPTNSTPNFGPSQKLDIELEIAAFVSRPNEMGDPIDIDDAEDHIFGYVLMNDWSARDIQAWEYVPLGPFNSKNLGTTVSGWIVTPEALEHARVARQDAGTLLPYLTENKRKGKEVFDIELEVLLRTQEMEKPVKLFESNASHLLYSFSQMLAHHTISGCAMRTGDLLGSGTISGMDAKTVGSLLEASQNGKNTINVGNGITRTWLEDGDQVLLTGHFGEGESRVGFGECAGQVLPAKWGRWQVVEGQRKS